MWKVVVERADDVRSLVPERPEIVEGECQRTFPSGRSHIQGLQEYSMSGLEAQRNFLVRGPEVQSKLQYITRGACDISTRNN